MKVGLQYALKSSLFAGSFLYVPDHYTVVFYAHTLHFNISNANSVYDIIN